jgi:outer membrane protein assembly factor BamB
MIFGACSKLHIEPSPALEPETETTPYLTAHMNYQRNAVAREQVKPPISILWDEEFISLPNRGFTTFEDLLVFGSYRGHTVFVDARTGKQKGKENFGDSCPVPPTIYGSILYQPFEAGSEGLIAYDFIEGKELWEVENLLSRSSPVVQKDKVYHLSMSGILTCYHYKSGEIIWRKDLKSTVKTSLAFKDNILIATTLAGNVCAFKSESGNQIWKSDLNTSLLADPVIATDKVYAGGYDGSLTIFNLNNGAILWKHTFAAPLYVSPTIDHGYLYVPVSDGQLIAFNEKTFANVWTFSAQGPPADAVLVSNDFIYFTTLEDRLYILDQLHGDLLQEIKLDGRPRSTPLISGGRLFISCEDNKIIAYAAQNDSI